jgi:ribulose-phosphate 3-epimerase
MLEEILPDVDQVLVMTVDPGFGHQHFVHSTLAKIGRVRQMIDRVKPECDLEVDGGIDPETARLCVEAGANVLVAGSSVFGTNESVLEAMNRLRAGGEGIYANRNDRTGKNGRQHGAAPHPGRPRVRGLRPLAKSDR